MELDEEKELERRAAKIFGVRTMKVKCWMCKKNMVGGIHERCEKCKVNNCLYCGNKLTKLRRLLENAEPLGDVITICTSKECAMRYNVGKLKGIWKTIIDEDTKSDYVQ
jgi:hypothetical protein